MVRHERHLIVTRDQYTLYGVYRTITGLASIFAVIYRPRAQRKKEGLSRKKLGFLILTVAVDAAGLTFPER